MKYRLSWIIPMHFSSAYNTKDAVESASWWQWRNRIFRHHTDQIRCI